MERLPRIHYVCGPIDSIALISVFFLLLVIIVLGTFIAPTRGLKIEPADISLASLPAVQGTWVVVAVDQEGRFYYKDQVIIEQLLEKELKNLALLSHPKPVLFILADRAAPHERVLRLYSLATKCGIERVYLGVRSSFFR